MIQRYSPLTLLAIAVVGRKGLAYSSCSASTTTQNQSFLKLKTKLKEIENLSGVRGLLGWDEMVLMAPGSSQARNEQNAVLASVLHEKQTSPELSELIAELMKPENTLDNEYDRAVIRDAQRDYRIESGKTSEQAMQEAELQGRGYQQWVSARKNNDYKEFEPVLREIVKLKKEIAKSTQPHLSPYDANVDLFERGMKSDRLTSILGATKTQLIPLIQKVCESEFKKTYQAPAALQGGELWSVEKQAAMCKEVAAAIGFDFNKGRLDVSVHPFTGGSHPTDVRITTRYSVENWREGVAGTVHEVGHALYEQGRNPNYANLPVSRALSMGVHESQSLFWERMIFQSVEFWEYFTPIVHRYFPHTKDVTVEEFHTYVNQVSPGFIRVEADELTYPLHIVLRFELEQAMFDESATASSTTPNPNPSEEDVISRIPSMWNSKMKESLGLVVDNDSQGCLQDIHWSGGGIGYFPSYTLGAMIAAQLYDSIEKELGTEALKGLIREGKFGAIREWLRTHIHKVGSLYDTPDELLSKVTGQPLNPDIYIQYLTKKYSSIYKL